METAHSALTELRNRSRNARPFLKWAGGKQPFLAKYSNRLPHLKGRYIEPFLGGGSVFFFMQKAERRPFLSLLSDTNLQLIKTFISVRDQPLKVLERLQHLTSGYIQSSDQAQYYQEVRATYNALLPKVDAATFIFLNRTCWNGLYRVNRAGKFNVPHGLAKGILRMPIEDDVLNASASLANSEIKAMSWQNCMSSAEPGDFVFADPPYYSDIKLEDTKYSRMQFSAQSHFELAESLSRLANRGVDFLLTNSADPEMVELYTKLGFEVEKVQVPRFISSKVDGRVSAGELIVRPAGTIVPRQLFLADELAEVIPTLKDD